MDALIVDVFRFCADEEVAEGVTPVADFLRLASETTDKAGQLRWSVKGGKNSLGYAQLTVKVDGAVSLVCQRCLSGMPFTIASESVIVLVKDEDGIDEIEALIDDDAVDVIVGSAEFDLMYLVEDDALLGLPVAPKHDGCPDAGAAKVAEDAGRVSPFAVLKDVRLKQ